NTAVTGLTNQTLCLFDVATFVPHVDGTGPFIYVWRKDGGLLTNQTNATLSVSISSAADAGLYSVEVSGVCNTATNSAVLNLNSSISVLPLTSTTNCVGSSVTFNTTPDPTYNYTWRKNG